MRCSTMAATKRHSSPTSELINYVKVVVFSVSFVIYEVRSLTYLVLTYEISTSRVGAREPEN